MEEFGSLNPSAAAALLNVTGLPPSLWNITAEDYRDFITLMNDGVHDNNSQPEVITNPMEFHMEERSEIGERITFDSKFIYSVPEFDHLISYNTSSSSEINNIVQQEYLRLPQKTLSGHLFLPEENFRPQLQSSDESSNRFISVSNMKANASNEDDGISSQFQNIEQKISIISSTKNLPTMNWDHGGYGAISSESNEQDESISLSSHQSKNIKSSQENHSGFGLTGENYLSFDSFGADSSTDQTGFRLTKEKPPKQKKPRSENPGKSSNINFSNSDSPMIEPDIEAIARMKEMIYRAAALRPINVGSEVIEKPKRKNVRISTDPQTAAARERRERISGRIRILQRLVPGGTNMDIASMLDEAANYLKYLKSQVSALQSLEATKNAKMNFEHFQSPSLTTQRP